MELKHIFVFFLTKNMFISFADGYIDISTLTSYKKYNASEMPQSINRDTGTKAPLNITVSMNVTGVDDVFEDDELFLAVDLKVKLSWYDSRLTYVDRDLQNYIFFVKEGAIWTPHLVWITERNARISKPYTFFRVYPNSSVIQYVTTTVKMKHSPGILNGFSIRLLSLNHTKETLTIEWDASHPLEISDDIYDYRIGASEKSEFEARTCHMTALRLSRKQGGECSCIELSVDKGLHRPASGVIVYAPGIVAVIISWACFWMEPSVVLGRAAVLLACLLHLLIQKVFLVQDLTLLKNVVILSSWLDGCIGFITAAFFLAVYVTYLNRTTNTSGRERLSTATTIQEEEEEGIVEGSDGEANTLCNHFHFPRIWLNRFPSTPDEINAICRVGFPLCFVIFVCVFFGVEY